MNKAAETELHLFMERVRKQNPGELEFHQAVQEVCETLVPYTLEHSHYRDAKILERPVEPDRIVICLLYTSPSPRDATLSRMPSSA